MFLIFEIEFQYYVRQPTIGKSFHMEFQAKLPYSFHEPTYMDKKDKLRCAFS
jgi:hypothetical protein